MFEKFLSDRRQFSWIFSLGLFLPVLLSSVHSASIMTYSSATNDHLEFLSNDTHRYVFLRQYFIRLINTSHSSFLQSMINSHQFTPNLEQSLFDLVFFSICQVFDFVLVKTRRRRQLSFTPMSSIHSTNCLVLSHSEIQTTFQLTQSIKSYTSLELIYHLHSPDLSIPIHLSIKHARTFKEFFSKSISLKYDSIRKYYSVNLSEYIFLLDPSNIHLEIILSNQTCQTSHGYLLFSSIRPQPTPQTTVCKLRTLQIKFEDLGLAHLIIRPKEYLFTYCAGSCSNLPSQTSFHTILQSLINEKHSQIPQLTCHPAEYFNDNFLLRQSDGNLQIYPISNAIVKRCACL